MTHLVSAIIPVYNGKQFLPDAVNSIRQQDYHPLEIIIVDDGSTDGTDELKDNFGEFVSYIYQENNGPAAARNSEIAEANGQFLAFLDSDDLWPERKLSTQIASLIREPDLEVILGHTICISENKDDLAEPVISVQLGSALFRRSAFERIGLFDKTLRFSEDHDWFLRARESNLPMRVSEDVTLYHRRHANNMTASRDARGYQLTAVLKASLDRRREHNKGDAGFLPDLSGYLKK